MAITNRLNLLLMTLNITIICFLFTACGDGDGEQSPSEITQVLKSNKWIGRDVSYGTGDNDHAWVDEESTTLYFISENKGVWYWIQKDHDTDLGNNTTKDYGDFTYAISGNSIMVDTGEFTRTFTYSQSGLYADEDVFQPYPMDSGDYDLLKEISPKTGSCGAGLTYAYTPKTKTLTISGTGDMSDYTSSDQPWHDFYIEGVVVEEGCTSIGSNAFNNLQYVTEVELPSTLTNIGNKAFAGSFITELRLPENVKSIGNSSFADCKHLKKVYLNDNLEEIGDYAFYGTVIKNSSFTTPKELRQVGDYAFSGWTIGTLTLNDKLESIGNCVFLGVKGTVKIPSSVKSVGSIAFEGSFNKVVLGTGVEQLTSGAFSSSASSGTFYVNLGIPVEIDGNVLCNNQQNWTLYVPSGSKKAYGYNTYWSKFKSIIEDSSLTSGNGTPSDDDDDYLVPKVDYTNLSYKIDGVTYKMILVDGGYLPPFYIMQTELPPDGIFQIGNELLTPINKNGDVAIIKSEFRAFLDKLRAATGLGFRLPTKAEWLFAAKGGKLSKDYTYCGSNNIDDVAWYKDNSSKTVHAIAQKQPNELGIYDMSGNYAELCSDMAKEDIYYFEGYLCGGNWSLASGDCKSFSVKNKPSSGKLNKVFNNKGAIDARTTTVRLVYSIPEK